VELPDDVRTGKTGAGKPMISKPVSQRLAALRFPLIVGVVFIHAYSTKVLLAGGTAVGVDRVGFAATFIRNLISQGVARIAVPLFFLMSGYLFFQGFDEASDSEAVWESYTTKVKRRVRTLLIPFLFWNCLTLAAFAIGQSLPATKVFFSNIYWPPVRAFHALDYANALLGVAIKFPMSYQFWFIRDLMAMVVLSPVVYVLVRRRPVGIATVSFLIALWFSMGWPLVWPADEAVAFFVLGAYLAVHEVDVCTFDRWPVLMALAFVPLLIVDAATGAQGNYIYEQRGMILVGLPLLWWLTKVAVENPWMRTALLYLGGCSFFVFAAHEPLLSILRKTAFRVLKPHSGLAELAIYFVVPLTVICFLVVLYGLLQRVVPGLMAVITGAEVKQKPLRGTVVAHSSLGRAGEPVRTPGASTGR
jgi:surface polysaccharide O-acyltransferase-like enzyme